MSTMRKIPYTPINKLQWKKSLNDQLHGKRTDEEQSECQKQNISPSELKKAKKKRYKK